jgi:hypothetical protein
LRKVKTDAIDAYHLCELYYKEELEPYKKRGIQLLNLRNLTRQQESISGISAQTKLQLHSVLDQIFPELIGVFGDFIYLPSLFKDLICGSVMPLIWDQEIKPTVTVFFVVPVYKGKYPGSCCS